MAILQIKRHKHHIFWLPVLFTQQIEPFFSFTRLLFSISHSQFSGYTALYYTIVIKRNPTFYDLVIVKPAVMLGVMTMFMFLAPATAADRYAYGTLCTKPKYTFPCNLTSPSFNCTRILLSNNNDNEQSCNRFCWTNDIS